MGTGSHILTHGVTGFVLKKCNIRPAGLWVYVFTVMQCTATKVNNSLTGADSSVVKKLLEKYHIFYGTFKLLNKLISFNEIWCEHCSIGGHPHHRLQISCSHH
jgi:hypothetical protein